MQYRRIALVASLIARLTTGRHITLRRTRPKSMLFRYSEVPTLPPLAWCARVDRGSDTVPVAHGTLVETRPEGFVEGAWNGAFATFDFITATVIVGTGAILDHGRARFTTSTDHMGPLFSIVKGDSAFVSNSPAFAMSAAHEEPDDIYPFYGYDLIRIYRQGLHCPDGRIRLPSGISLGVHFSAIITIDERGRMEFCRHRLCEPFNDYRSYKTLLLEGLKGLFENAADPSRKRTYRPVVSLSNGYDSTAAAALARTAGCTEAMTFVDERRDDPVADSGTLNARILGMECSEYSRWQYIQLEGLAEAEFAYTAANSTVSLAAAENQVRGCILLNGDFGDTIWVPKAARVSTHLSRPWLRYALGVTQIEFRLRVGYQGIAVPSIGARRNQAVYEVAVSEEMRPWSIGGDYDRPIPRRIAEEAGLPRDRFGMRKAATGHSHLNDASRFSETSLNDYRRFVTERHALAPRHTYRYWRARAWWHHCVLKTVGGRDRRYVPSTFLQRRFPFVLNARPIATTWDYMFTFQWAVAAMQSRYAMTAAEAPSNADPRVIDPVGA